MSRRASAPRLVLCAGLVTAFLIATADVAEASLFLEFDRTHGRPGTIVHVHTAGNGACVVCPHHLRLYFAQAAIAGEISSPDDPRLVPVGRLTVDGYGNGRGRLTVPFVPDGEYIVMMYCEACAPGSGGRATLPLGPDPPFRITGRHRNVRAPQALNVATQAFNVASRVFFLLTRRSIGG